MDERTTRIVKLLIAGFILAVITNAIALFVTAIDGQLSGMSCKPNSTLTNCIGGSICPAVIFAYSIFLIALLVDCAIGVLLFLYSLTRRGKNKENIVFWATSFIMAGAFSFVFKILTPVILSWSLGAPVYC